MAPETIAGRYHVERAIGRGGMGTVWLCLDELLGRHVAVKQVGTMPGEPTPVLARALREARSSAALHHPNVVSIFDAVEEGDHVWLVMEYVAGRTLGEMVNQDGPLPPERAAWIGAQVADGLAAAHERGTIHRDVKPGNILVTADDVAKVSDFGIARTHGDARLTQSGMVTGTPLYFSPELARGEDPTAAADVWALGASLYTAVEGHPPYPEQRNPIAMLSTIASGHPPRPHNARFLTTPIARMLDPDPASRWSMADAAHALHKLSGQHPSQSKMQQTASFAAGGEGDPPGEAPPQPPQPPPTPVAPAAPPPQQPRRRNRAGLVATVAAVLLLVLLAVVGYLLLDDPGGQEAADSPRTSAPADEQRSTSPSPKKEKPDGPSSKPAESVTKAPETTPAAAPPGGGQRFVANYYTLLPDDTEEAWSRLSPGFQARIGSYENYRSFWSTIDSVTVQATRRVSTGTVEVELTYVSASGVETEVRRIFLERSGGGFLITGDALA